MILWTELKHIKGLAVNNAENWASRLQFKETVKSAVMFKLPSDLSTTRRKSMDVQVLIRNKCQMSLIFFSSGSYFISIQLFSLSILFFNVKQQVMQKVGADSTSQLQ